ncbi:unnamed protein product [Meganyctiphanes norvegica]|uniref:Uncharacterized protein n=1 Tax=Meganyctiphanes norvegica TaxID=48144 RepID=A0AAV2RUH9_MEGNR
MGSLNFYSFSDLSGPLKIFSGLTAIYMVVGGGPIEENCRKEKKHVIIFRGLFNFYSFSGLSGPLNIFSGPKAVPNDTWEWEGILLKKIVENEKYLKIFRYSFNFN